VTKSLPAFCGEMRSPTAAKTPRSISLLHEKIVVIAGSTLSSFAASDRATATSHVGDRTTCFVTTSAAQFASSQGPIASTRRSKTSAP
jgi:hypothetical protein